MNRSQAPAADDQVYQLMAQGEYEKAFAELAARRLTEQLNSADVHLLAILCMETGRYMEATRCYATLLESNDVRDLEWFGESARLGRAYALTLLKDYAAAKHDLDLLADDDEITWLENLPPISVAALRARPHSEK